nr:unnamed protein product [Callosobruchus analis]
MYCESVSRIACSSPSLNCNKEEDCFVLCPPKNGCCTKYDIYCFLPSNKVNCMRPVRSCCYIPCGESQPNCCPIPREVANYCNRNHKKNTSCPYKPCFPPSTCPPEPCCSPPRRCPPSSCYPPRSCAPEPCNPPPTCPPQDCKPCPPRSCGEQPYCNSPRRYCRKPSPCNCKQCQVIATCTPLCVRCGCKVYAAEKIILSKGAYHNSCFSCYCCQRCLDIKSVYEAEGEIYCKRCYNTSFGNDYIGFGSTLQPC